uniref:Uncharacterized protein n=1 Tax=Glossina austeni TaxID=7395 RepID=A0A1A9VHL4_GLOAU
MNYKNSTKRAHERILINSTAQHSTTGTELQHHTQQVAAQHISLNATTKPRPKKQATSFYCMSNLYYNSAFKLNHKQLQHSLLLKLREPNTNAAAITEGLKCPKIKFQLILVLKYQKQHVTVALSVSARRWFVLCILIRFVVVSSASLVEHEYILTALGTYCSEKVLMEEEEEEEEEELLFCASVAAPRKLRLIVQP